MVLYSIVVAVCSRYFKVKIMEKKGVRSIEQYHKYLHVSLFPLDSSVLSECYQLYLIAHGKFP